MAAPTWIECFTEPLERLDIAYMITGSVASMIYAEPRTTLDIDLVVELDVAGVDDFLAAFPDSAFYRPPPEIVREECARDNRGHFNLIHHETGFKADIYLAGSDPLHRWALVNRRRIADDVAPFTLAPPEYVVIRKLEFWREGGSAKHLRDVRAIVAGGLALDRDLLEKEIAERGLQRAWQQIE
ncbi:MAG TPA: hypothetical protein VKQ06_09620 [Gammaproteobacteria bacterium]|nr:hypothetical protein [Gammaproteobacteria bacterium]